MGSRIHVPVFSAPVGEIVTCARGVGARIDRLAVTGTRSPNLRIGGVALVEGGGLGGRCSCSHGGEDKGA